ncbi:MAG: sensor histidine kinase [Lachnospiraceae bacterium]
MRHSIQLRITITFMFLACSLILGSIGVNRYYLETYYQYEKQEILNAACSEVEDILQANMTSEEKKIELDRVCLSWKERYNITSVIMSIDKSEIHSYASQLEFEILVARNTQYSLFGQEGNVIWSDDNYRIVKIYDKQMNSYYLDAYGMLDGKYLFILSSPMESIRESADIANKFLVYTGILLMIVTSVLMMIVTKRITLPILKLASISKRMARLDFSERYCGSDQDEIGILGSSINEMAEQLEKTIVELKEANEQLKKDIEEKIQIDEMRKEFLSNVSHELKTPLALISGYAEGLQESINDDDPESRQFYCEVIIDETNKMSKMVQKLLTLNHLEFGQDAVEISSFDLSELISGVVESNALRVKQKLGTIQMNIPKHMIVLADEFKIEEVVTNYVSNAINHLDYAKEIQIYMTEDMEHVQVHVFNTGNHIPDEDLDKVWIKFYKVDKARTREYGGSGIGLSIVKAIMDSHKEPFGVLNVEGGVEFWFQVKKDNQIMNQMRLALPEKIENAAEDEMAK